MSVSNFLEQPNSLTTGLILADFPTIRVYILKLKQSNEKKRFEIAERSKFFYCFVHYIYLAKNKADSKKDLKFMSFLVLMELQYEKILNLIFTRQH